MKRARELRNNSTASEVLLWKKLTRKKLMGYQFSRQKPINNYIVDFYCPMLKLVIEIDGDSHATKQDYDAKRESVLIELGLDVIRFNDLDVKDNMDGVIRTLENFVFDFEGKAQPPAP